MTRVDADEYIQECLHAIINGAEIVLDSFTVGRFTYNITTSNRNQRDTPMKTDIFRTLNIISVAADGKQTEELLISGHNVAVR